MLLGISTPAYGVNYLKKDLDGQKFIQEDPAIDEVVLLPPDQASDEDEGNDDGTGAPTVNDVLGTIEVDFRPGSLEDEQFETSTTSAPKKKRMHQLQK
ncbi:hypothetical protein QYM36_003872 [Artemia franciscana]|uniref:Uncharacterized protein n=1 Tax=Artemia franciscana TaxID=6661 RepID=A0AA88I7H0_ARTSF|nr:hypothetical protein QYM36_003872 [Artemia franciscana]